MPTLIRLLLCLRGWRFEGELPPDPKFVAIGYPHTSNWDFFVFLAAMSHFKIRPKFIGKHSLFWWPLGAFMRAMGGIPVRRDRPGRLVEQVAASFAAAESMILVMAPEGTRSQVAHWKAGFYRIAHAAGIPVVPAYLDRPWRRAGLGPAIHLTGDLGADMDRIRAAFAAKLSDPRAVAGIRMVGEG